MGSSKLSQSPVLVLVATIFATIWVAGGVNCILRPTHALSLYEFVIPEDTAAFVNDIIYSLMVIYGVRDIFMGVAIYAAVYFRDRKTLGWILIAGSAVAFVDGAVCFWGPVGTGEWGHWGYAPAVAVVGALLAGVLDRP
jgi:hypothetical protein